MMSRFCMRCGTAAAEDARFCLHCGNPLPEQTPDVSPADHDTEIPPQYATYHAPAPTERPAPTPTRYCRHCGGVLRTGDAFCGHCGTRVGEGTAFCAHCGERQ